MKIIYIGDTHGHSSWADIIDNEEFDIVVLMGDYVDSFTVKPEVQRDNLLKIKEYKEKYGDKLIVIYGNHDHSYLEREKCSGWNPITDKLCTPILKEMKDKGMFHLSFIYDDIIATHAGISKYWLKEVAFLTEPQYVKFGNFPTCYLDWNCIKGYNGYGDTISQSPIWIRPASLLQDKIDGYRQIVGHTKLKMPYNKDGIWFNDQMPEYYIIYDSNKPYEEQIEFKKNEYFKNN